MRNGIVKFILGFVIWLVGELAVLLIMHWLDLNTITTGEFMAWLGYFPIFVLGYLLWRWGTKLRRQHHSTTQK